jgi:amidase
MKETSIRALGALMASGELTSRKLTEYYLDRIEAVDQAGHRINAVIEVNPEAMAIARARDREMRRGKVRGPLHGIPILIKDNIDTRDRMQTTAGSLALQGWHARRDAFIVRQLRAAGAVLLGKANLSEWANFRGTHSVSGWSSRGGLTRNPYALNRTACGSSSGSAAAVAASLCAASVGTETDGSIICPSQSCGVVGLKPTLGLLSRSGIIPIAASQDTAGPIGRTVEDVALMLGAMTGIDRSDRATAAARKYYWRDYTAFLRKDALRGARIGVARNMLGSDGRLIAVIDHALGLMKQMGAVVIDPADLPHFNQFADSELEVLHTEFKAGLNRYLRGVSRKLPVHSLADVIRFNEANRQQVMPYFGQERMLVAQEKGPLTDKSYRRALKRNHRLARQQGIDALLRRKRLEAIVVASGGPAWTIDLANGDALSWDLESTSPAAVAGYPHITVPAGEVMGLPVGISFFAGAWSEPILLGLAYAFEQASQARVPPRYHRLI